MTFPVVHKKATSAVDLSEVLTVLPLKLLTDKPVWVVIFESFIFYKCFPLHSSVVRFGWANICCKLKISSVYIKNTIVKPKQTNKPHKANNTNHEQQQKGGRAGIIKEKEHYQL